MSKFHDRLKALGFHSYEAYLNSNHWIDFKKRYAAAGLSMVCAVCNITPVQLHHITYERLGCEEFIDVIPLCRTHHNALHDWLKQYKKGNVSASHKGIAFLKSQISPHKSKKSKSQTITKDDRLSIIVHMRRIKNCTSPNSFWNDWKLFQSQSIEDLRVSYADALKLLNKSKKKGKRSSQRRGKSNTISSWRCEVARRIEREHSSENSSRISDLDLISTAERQLRAIASGFKK
jgi:hypothetical protein